ncbi:MAG: hypothetical protein U9Q58_06195, partial [Pseudomonadota bacterium]|nr:hypothetical protein [Pseudomonadota bacterium]
MLLSDAVIKFFPELVEPVLTRKKSKSHWRKTRNKTKREKAAAILATKKNTVICKRLIHGKEEFPVLDISDDDVDICITKEFTTVEIDVSNDELTAHDIEMTGDCCRAEMTCLITDIINRIAA